MFPQGPIYSFSPGMNIDGNSHLDLKDEVKPPEDSRIKDPLSKDFEKNGEFFLCEEGVDFRTLLSSPDDQEDFLAKLEHIKKRLRKFSDKALTVQGFLGMILIAIEYAKVNQDNEMAFAQSYLPAIYHEKIRKGLKIAERVILWVNSVSLAIFHGMKARELSGYSKEIRKLQDKFTEKYHNKNFNVPINVEDTEKRKLKFHVLSIQRLFNEVHHIVANENAKVSSGLSSKVSKMFFDAAAIVAEELFFFSAASKVSKCLGFGLNNIRSLYMMSEVSSLQEKWLCSLQTTEADSGGIDERTFADFRTFLNFVKDSDKPNKIKERLSEYGITEPLLTDASDDMIDASRMKFINAWQMKLKDDKFIRQLYIAFCSAKGKSSIIPIQFRDIRYQKDRISKIEKAIQEIRKEMQNERFYELVSRSQQFKDGDYSPLQKFILKKFKTPGRYEVLAEQWVDYHQIVEKELLESFRVALIRKNGIEQKSIFFYKVERVVGIGSSIIHFCLFFPLTTGKAILKMCVVDLAKIPIGNKYLVPLLLFPLNPEMSFKIDNIVMQVFKKFYMGRHKQHEYSVEGYWISFEIKILGFGLLIQQSFYVVGYLANKTYIVVIKNGVFKCNIPLNQEEESEFALKNKIEKLKKQLHQLKLKDVPDLTSFLDQLNEVDVNYLSPLACQFFRENMGISLINAGGTAVFDNSKRRHLEEFFCLEGEKFINSYRMSRFSSL